MQAARVHQFGKALVVEEAPELEPQPDEVLVRVEACGVCHSDLHMIRGDWPDVAKRTPMPATLGHEVVGRVVHAGAQAQGLAAGARVGVGWLYSTCEVCEFCRDNAENICLYRQVTGLAAPGGFAEYIRIRASHAVPVPESLKAEEAAPLFCAGLTVFHALRNCGVQAGQRVAIFGIGGLGHLAAQLAAHVGAHVIGVDVSEVAARQAKARYPALMAAVIDLDRFSWPDRAFDVILNFYFLSRPLCRQYRYLLRPGGVLIFESLLKETVIYRPDFNPDYLLAPGELRELCAGLEILVYREGWISRAGHHPRAVASLVARRS